MIVTPATRPYMSDTYPYRLLPASFLLRPCMLVPLPHTPTTVQMTGEDIDLDCFCVNDFYRPLNARNFRDCASVPVYPALTREGVVRLVPPQIAQSVDPRWGSNIFGVVTRFDVRTSRVRVKQVSSAGVGGNYTGGLMQRGGKHVVLDWNLTDIVSLVNGGFHSNRYSWHIQQ